MHCISVVYDYVNSVKQSSIEVRYEYDTIDDAVISSASVYLYPSRYRVLTIIIVIMMCKVQMPMNTISI